MMKPEQPGNLGKKWFVGVLMANIRAWPFFNAPFSALFLALLVFLPKLAWSACSNYVGQVVFNEVYDPSSGSAFVEIKTINPGVVSATNKFAGWKIDLYKNNSSTKASTDLSSLFTNIAENNCGQNSVWIRIPDSLLNNYISGSNGSNDLNFVIYETAGSKIVDVLRLGAASSFYSGYATCPGIESALPSSMYDAAWGSNGNKDWYRDPDGSGPWGGQATADNSHTICGDNNGGSAFSLGKVPNVTTVAVNTNFTYTLHAQNGSTGSSISSLTITDNLTTAGLTFVSCSPSQGSCTQSGGTVTWSAGTLHAGASATATLTVTASSAGTVTNKATTTTSGTGSPTATATTVTVTASAPTVTTNAATSVTNSGATLNGTVSSNGAAATVTFDYGLTTSYGTTVTATQSPLATNASNSAVSAALTGLTCNTTYHFRVKASNSAGTTNGGDLTFTTSSCPTISIANASTTEGNSGTKTLSFTVTQNATSALATTATYTLTNGTATGDASCTGSVDYVNTGGTVTIAAGSTTGTIAVTICGDTSYEADETFTVTLSSPSNATLATSTATGTITNDDTPTLSIADVSVNEGNSGTTTMSFPVTLSAAIGVASSANFTTTAGTATSGASCTTGIDYITTSGTVTIAAGSTTGTISVTICGDTTYEVDEAFTVTLSAPTNATLGTSTATGTLLNDDPPQILGDWRMDETSWNGTANEVKDSSGNGNHGTAKIAAGSTPVSTSLSGTPAYTSGSQSTCNYGQFDSTSGTIRTYTYVELSNLPTLPASFTFAAWIRSTNVGAQHQRILVRDDADNGWGLSLADGTGQGELRFFNRNITNSGTVTGQGRDPGCGVFCLDTNVVLTSNNWHYIAAAIDTSAKTVTLYVYNASGTQLAKTSSGFSGTWADGTGKAAIGGETSASSEGRQTSWHFLGNIDEMQIYSGVLMQSTIESLLTRVRTCPGTAPDHLRIEHDGNASTCTAESITVKACADTACSTLYTSGGVTATLQPFGTSVSIGVSGSTTLSVTPSSSGVNTLSATAISPTPTGSTQYDCLNTTTNVSSCSLSVSACPGGANFDCLETSITPYASGTSRLYTKLAGTGFAFDVAALKTGNTVETNYVVGSNSKSVTVELGTATNAACAGWVALSPPISQTLSFDASNQGRKSAATMTVSKVYPKLRCRVTDANGPSTVYGCSSNDFSVRPTGLTVTSSSANADSTGTSSSATPKVKAGATYDLIATAVAGYDGTPLLQDNSSRNRTWLEAHSGASRPGIASGTFNAATATTGIASGSAFTYDEVGYFRLKTDAIHDDTFTAVDSASGDCTSDFSNNLVSGKYGCKFGNTADTVYFGRFYPDHFIISPETGDSLIDRAGINTGASETCASTFTYLDEEFKTRFILTAQNASNATTQNYTGSFAKYDPTVWNNFVFTASNLPTGSTLGTGATAPTGTWSSGVANVLAFHKASRPATPVAPGVGVSISAKPVDSDGVTTSSAMLVHGGSTELRFGRLRLSNVLGSEKSNLTVPIQVQYWSGSSWVINNDDSCTSLPSSAFALSGTLAPPKTSASAVTLTGGNGSMLLIKATPTDTGSVDIAVNLGIAGSDQSCMASHSGIPSSLPWLRSQNGSCATTFDRDPSARATFGIYSPETQRSIHVRELY
ncbi:MSHA biogenesis protein MshQ [Gammaproteobacteria bacterium]